MSEAYATNSTISLSEGMVSLPLLLVVDVSDRVRLNFGPEFQILFGRHASETGQMTTTVTNYQNAPGFPIGSVTVSTSDLNGFVPTEQTFGAGMQVGAGAEFKLWRQWSLAARSGFVLEPSIFVKDDAPPIFGTLGLAYRIRP
jgi:hypothetical protein